MASPFRVFRKNQKLAFAILAVMAIIAFVFLPSTGTISGGRGADPLAVETSKFGNLRASQLQSLLGQRQHVLGFLASLEAEARDQTDVVKNVHAVRSVIGPATEESVVDKWLFARQAEELGVVVDDATINEFLKRITADRINSERIANILQQQRGGLSEAQLFAILHDELLALRFRQLFFQTQPLGVPWVTYSIPPGQRCDYYKRLNCYATIETAAVPVERYLKDVADPKDEKVLLEFFDLHKDTIPTSDSPEPGFRQARKVSLEYLEADQAKFLAAVTDAEVNQEYEANKEQWDKRDQEMKPAEPAAKKEAEKKPAPAEGKKSEAPKGEIPKTKDADLPKAKVSPAEKKAEKPLVAPVPPSAPKPKDADKPASAPKPAGHSAASPASPFRLVANAVEKAPATASGKAPEAKPTTPPKAAEPAKKPEAPAATPPAQSSKLKAQGSKPAAAPHAKPIVPAKKPEPVKTGPSARLKAEIRERLARQKAARVLFKLEDTLRGYRIQWTQYDAERRRNAQATMPPPPDFAVLAKQNGLIAGKTGLVSQPDFETTDLGKSIALGAGEAQGQMTVAKAAFQSKVQYSPELSWDFLGNQYLFWKTDEVPDRVPKFSDEGVKEEVLRAWKMVEARKLARAGAEKLKGEAARAGRPLKEVLADRKEFKVVRPEPFSWLTYGSVPQESSMFGMSQPRLNRIEGVEYPSTGFMETVFALTPGELGVAANAPETAYYVIRMVEVKPPDAGLFKSFVENDTFSRYAAVAFEDQKKVDKAWIDEIRATAGLKWAKKPTDRRAAAEDYDD